MNRLSGTMKAFPCFFYVVLLSAALSAVASKAAEAQRGEREPDPTGFAVIEYFTSEGCAQCPSTGEVAAKVVESSGGVASRVFLLSLHVDSSNTLSWRDPYGTETQTLRQQEYIKQLKKEPAIPGTFVINGDTYVGSSSPVAIQRAISEVKSKKSRAQVVAAAAPIAGEKAFRVVYKVQGLEDLRRPFFLLHFAAVQPEVTKTLTDGRNQGTTLTHTNLVRSFQSRRIEATDSALVSGKIDILLPIEVDPKEVELIAFLQDPRTLEILGAQAVVKVADEAARQ